MNLLFIITGIGYGDSTRQHAIIEEFLKKSKKNKILIAAYDNSYKYFRNKYPVIKIKGYKFVDKNLRFRAIPFAIKNILLPLNWIYLKKPLIKKAKNFNPDFIISDFEPLGLILSKYTKKKCISIFGFDPLIYEKLKKNPSLGLQSRYLKQMYNQSDYTIIPSFVNKGTRKNITYVNPIMRKIKHKKAKTRNFILVLLGGSTLGSILAKKIVTLSKNLNEKFIIIGSNIKLPKAKNIKYYPFKENIHDYMQKSKAIITLGGNLTLTEALYFKKPIMSFPIKNHVEQLVNAKALEKHIFVSYDLNNLQKKLEYFLSNLTKFKKHPKLKFNGAKQVVDFICSLKSKN